MNVSAYYAQVDDILRQYGREGTIDFDMFCAQVKLVFHKLKRKNLPQKVIFDNLVKWLVDSTHGELEPCETVILEKLFGVYPIVKDFKEERDRTKDNWDTYDAAGKKQYIHGASVIKSNKEFEENEERIAALKDEIAHMEEQMDAEMVSGDSKMTDEAAEIKGQITVLRRQRSRLISQQNAAKISKSGGHVPSGQDMKALSKFFPTVNMKHLEEIEYFHTAIQRILTEEVGEETFRLQTLIDAIDRDIARLENEQRKLGVPVKLPIAFLRKHSDLAHTIEELEEQNRQYNSPTD